MIDVYAAEGTFADKHTLAQNVARAVMRWEQVPDIPLFSDNTAASIHDLPAEAISNAAGARNDIRVQVNFANAGASVVVLVRGPKLQKKMSAYLVERIRRHPRVEARLETVLTAVHERDGRLEGISTSNDGQQKAERADLLFICIGGVPHTAWCAVEHVETDSAGFILTGQDLRRSGISNWPLGRDPFPLETSRPGLFAVGYGRSYSTKRVAGAIGDGAMAAALAFQRLAELSASASDAPTRRIRFESAHGVGRLSVGKRILAGGLARPALRSRRLPRSWRHPS